MIGNWTGIECGENAEGRLSTHHLRFAGVLERKPDFIAVAAHRQIWRKRTGLRDTGNDLVTLHVHNIEFRSKTRRHKKRSVRPGETAPFRGRSRSAHGESLSFSRDQSQKHNLRHEPPPRVACHSA